MRVDRATWMSKGTPEGSRTTTRSIFASTMLMVPFRFWAGQRLAEAGGCAPVSGGGAVFLAAHNAGAHDIAQSPIMIHKQRMKSTS